MNKEEMEKKRDKIAESGEYSEGESCSFYMSEIEAFKAGWDACAEEYEKEIEQLEERNAYLYSLIEGTD